MKLSIRQKIMLLSLVVVLGNGFLGYAVYSTYHKLNESAKWIQHTEEVLFLSGNILSLAKDVETSSRGFVVTNDSTFLEPLIIARKSIFPLIGQLKRLIADNSVQQRHVDSLSYYITMRLNFSMQTIESRAKHGLSSAIAMVASKRGEYYSNHMRQIANDIQNEESILLIKRNQTNANSLTTFSLLSIAMLILMTAFIILLIIATGNHLVQTKEKAKRTAELNTANQDLLLKSEENEKQEGANKELEAFSYSVSHDLRAPLRHIGGYVDLLIKNNSSQLDEKGLRYLDIISESSVEMGNLIDALLTFSRLSRAELERTEINSNALVNRIIGTFSDELSGRNVEFNVSELPDTRGDENLIGMVWVNLISNALKYSRKKEKAVIDIGGKMENGTVIFFIRDNGAGFDMKYADKLFGVFQRLHKTRDFEGIGIGLANVNRIVVRHGGKCWAESQIDKGATFFFSLPN
ncbi:MAG: CHASE3 domain-containing protein [Bacteroidota bacterium]